MVGVATWNSSISMLEPAVTYLVERTKRSRALVTTIVAIGCWVVVLFAGWVLDREVVKTELAMENRACSR